MNAMSHFNDTVARRSAKQSQGSSYCALRRNRHPMTALHCLVKFRLSSSARQVPGADFLRAALYEANGICLVLLNQTRSNACLAQRTATNFEH